MKMNKLKYFIKKFLAHYAAQIDQRSVIKDIVAELDLSPGYLTLLNLANLIALFGLLTNSVAVIIGAMLISPLMGPMISFGFSFVIGDDAIWKKSLKKVSVSVAVTILVAALATFFSPLNDITHEILARTKPNLFDLLIAFLAGSAGAAALCTKKNYLTVVPGVAIATAVIPPLSVAGFGLGIGNLHIASGGFFLFFTNFVAIVITSCAVFYFYGFRPAATYDIENRKLKKRITLLLLLLFIISIPLIYTLGVTIAEAKLRKDVKTALQEIYDRKGLSRLSEFSYVKSDKNSLEIDATVQTVTLIQDRDIALVETRLADKLRRNIKFSLVQHQVVQGGLKEEPPGPRVPLMDQVKPPEDLIRNSREEMLKAVIIPLRKIEAIISPSQLMNYSVGIQKNDSRLSILLKIRRDNSLSGEQIRWLAKMLEADLKSPVVVSIETVPFVPILFYNSGEITLSEEKKDSLSVLRHVYDLDRSVGIMLENGPESSRPYRERMANARQRSEAIATFINSRFHIPASQIKIKIMDRAVKVPFVKVTVLSKEIVGMP